MIGEILNLYTLKNIILEDIGGATTKFPNVADDQSRIIIFSV